MLSQQETNIEEKKIIFKICILLSDVYKKKKQKTFKQVLCQIHI